MGGGEINGGYEVNSGVAIIRAFEMLDPISIPAVLVANHGPFAWGLDARKAAENAWMLEAAARIAYFTVGIDPLANNIGKTLLDRPFLEKHGNPPHYHHIKINQ